MCGQGWWDGMGWADPALETCGTAAAALQIGSCFIFTTQHTEPDAALGLGSPGFLSHERSSQSKRARLFPGLRWYPNNLVSLSMTSGWAGERVTHSIAQVLPFPDEVESVNFSPRGCFCTFFPCDVYKSQPSCSYGLGKTFISNITLIQHNTKQDISDENVRFWHW